jgi:DHA1 family bicyclomycin/chloramphenicol resistance-like MFS transporter
VLGNDELALALVMTVGMVIALFALSLTLRLGVIGDAVPELT